MAIKICTGDPRSGKSYYAVWHLTTKYFNYDKILNEYHPKEIKDHAGKKTKFTIITNIEELKLPHLKLEELLREYGCVSETAKGIKTDPSKLFNLSVQEELTKKYGVLVYLIDEAHELFPDRFASEECFNYFRRHGHFGHEFYLITQYWPAISRFITGLAEYEIKVVPRSFSATGERRYHFIKSGEKIGSKILKPDPWIHALYRSSHNREVEKTLNPIRKLAIIVLLLAVGIGVMVKIFIYQFSGGSVAAATKDPPENSRSAAPAVAGVGGGRSEGIEKRNRRSALDSEQMVRVKVGVLWMGSKPFAIQWGNKIINVKEWMYGLEYTGANDPVYAYVPENVWESLRFVSEVERKAKEDDQTFGNS